MAEQVNRRTELQIPEFQELQNLQIFSASSMRYIIKTHNNYEYKLRRRGKTASMFLNYAAYKIKFLALCRKEMEDHGIQRIQRNNIESSMKLHIKKLYRTCVKLFPSNVDAWDKYITFLKKEKLYSEGLQVYTNMLKFHNKPKTYIQAANFAKKYCDSIERARKLLMESIHVHADEKELYLELFKLELKHSIEKWKDFRDDEEILEEDPVLQGLLAEGVFYSAAEKFPDDIKYLFSFFFACRKCQILQKLPLNIYNAIKKSNLHNAELWHRLGAFQLSGMDCESNKNQIVLVKSKTIRAKRCLAIYKEGLKKLPTDAMLNQYLETVFSLPAMLPNCSYVYDHFRNIVKKPFVLKRMKLSHYLTWLNVLETQQSMDAFNDTLNYGLMLHTNRIELWILKLRHCDSNDVLTILKDAKIALKDVSDHARLWETILNMEYTPETLSADEILNELLKLPCSQLATLKMQFLTWIHSRSDINTVWRIFNTLSDVPPYSLELYEQMITFAKEMSEPNVNHIRKCYEDACRNFGSESHELWLKYIMFEKDYGIAESIAPLHWRAVLQLEPTKSDEFIKNFNFWKTNYWCW